MQISFQNTSGNRRTIYEAVVLIKSNKLNQHTFERVIMFAISPLSRYSFELCVFINGIYISFHIICNISLSNTFHGTSFAY